jgi:hypothetical protein
VWIWNADSLGRCGVVRRYGRHCGDGYFYEDMGVSMTDIKEALDEVTKIGQEIDRGKPSAAELLREAREIIYNFIAEQDFYGISVSDELNLISRIDAHLASQPASQPDCVMVPVDVKTILVVMQVLTFLKGVLIGLGFKSDSSSINQLEIAYSMLSASKEPTK